MIFCVFQNFCGLHLPYFQNYNRFYFLHRSRDSMSPLCGIFKDLALWAESFYKSSCPCVCVCVHFLFTPFKHLFAPTSWSPMSKLFRYSESLGKSNGKMWCQIWKLLFIKIVKSPRQKKFFPNNFFYTSSLRKPTSRWTRELWSKGISLILAYR